MARASLGRPARHSRGTAASGNAYRKVKAVERRVQSNAMEGVTISTILEVCGLSYVVQTTWPALYVAACVEQDSQLDVRMPENRSELEGRIALASSSALGR